MRLPRSEQLIAICGSYERRIESDTLPARSTGDSALFIVPQHDLTLPPVTWELQQYANAKIDQPDDCHDARNKQHGADRDAR